MTINPNQFLNDLITTMGMDGESESTKIELKEAMMKQLNHQIGVALSLSLEPDVIDDTLDAHMNETDDQFVLFEMVKNSPHAQMAIMEVFNTFWDETLEANKALAK